MKIFLFFPFLLFIKPTYSQEINLQILDSLNTTPVKEAIIIDSKGTYISKSNEKGIAIINNENFKEIIIVSENYETKNIYVNSDLKIIKLSKKSIELLPVEIKKKSFITVGNTNRKRGFPTGEIHNGEKVKNLICVTMFTILKPTVISRYNFFIVNKQNNSPFNFQLYNEKEGKPNQVIYNQYVSDYEKGWNSVNLLEFISLDPGTYYFGMQWLPKEDFSDVWYNGQYKIAKEKIKKYSVGQILGMNIGSENIEGCYSFKSKWSDNYLKLSEMKSSLKAFMQNIEIYEN